MDAKKKLIRQFRTINIVTVKEKAKLRGGKPSTPPCTRVYTPLIWPRGKSRLNSHTHIKSKF